jgi:hypothetical protein
MLQKCEKWPNIGQILRKLWNCKNKKILQKWAKYCKNGQKLTKIGRKMS